MRKYGCRIFADFQKVFDTVDHAILIQTLNYYGVRGNANNDFFSYLKNRKNLSLLMVSVQTLKILTVEFPKCQYQEHSFFLYTSMNSLILLNFAMFIILLINKSDKL